MVFFLPNLLWEKKLPPPPPKVAGFGGAQIGENGGAENKVFGGSLGSFFFVLSLETVNKKKTSPK